MVMRVEHEEMEKTGLYRVTRRKGQFLGGHSISHSKEKSVYVHASYSKTVSKIQLLVFHCTLYRRATCHVLTRVAKCIHADGEIFENALY
jgi:hypothetical protein